MSPAATLVAAVEIKAGGQSLDPSIMERLLEARVQDNLLLPDAFLLRLRDPDFQLIDGSLFEVGTKIELRYAPTGTAGSGDPFTGEVATIAPQFESEGCVLVVRGYDLSHKLILGRKTRTFQDMTGSDIASKVIGEAGLTADVEPTKDVYPFEQQSNETDWHYLWRLAKRVGYELTFAGDKVFFRAPGKVAGAPVKLEWGDNLRAFHPRATGVSQVDEVTVSGWDPKAKRRVSSTKSSANLDSTIGLDRDKVAANGKGKTFAITDHVVTTQGEADALAQSTLDSVANRWLEAEGVCRGHPSIRAGSKVKITGVGTRFGGEYLVTKSTHVMRGAKGYETEFEITGRSRRTLVDLLTPTRNDHYTDSLVVGVVTNNDDPEKMGRVRVKFPGLDEQKEGWWARVASLSATADRGMLMMPLVDDEVVVGFEHGDPRRPFVLGSLWNGTAKPGELAAEGGGSPDGSFRLSSLKQIAMTSEGKFAMTSEGKVAITSNGDEISITGPGGSVVIAASGAIEVKGSQVTVNASGNLKLSASGVVQVSGSQVTLG